MSHDIVFRSYFAVRSVCEVDIDVIYYVIIRKFLQVVVGLYP